MDVMENNKALPNGFIYLREVDPTILQDVKYASNDNFMGRPAKGYEKPVIILTMQAAEVLKNIQAELKQFGLGLKVFDGYRPQMAIDDFWDWANDPKDTKMKAVYYPNFDDKKDLFNGFIAKLSQHSRGSTVDLTIVELHNNKDLDMGGIFDLLDEVSNTNYPHISTEARINRMLLKSIMGKYGFDDYRKEWWHFNLLNEPFPRKPEDHFNFPVK